MTSLIYSACQICYNGVSSSMSLLNNKVIPAMLFCYLHPGVGRIEVVMDSIQPCQKNGNFSSPASHKRVPRDNPQDILIRMKDHNLIIDFDHWTGLGRQACFRYARENKKPLDWAQACSKNAERHCIACGSDMKGREVWEYYKPGGNKRCICKLCRHEYTMDDDGNLQRISPRVISTGKEVNS